MLREDPPTHSLYSPATSSHPSLSTLKTDKYNGSTSTFTTLLSPAANGTFSQATSLFGGSPAFAGNPT